ncbi:MAG: hypothetical protein JWP03_3485 [Phycisphaerales bacterium]|jgi:hypothetical protein|nr:hypothetical protein [Phycisphaerales bacterium]
MNALWHRAVASLHFDPLTLFGLAAVSAMLIFYTLEESAPIYTLAFAGACFMGSAYGFLQGAWPFGIVEGIWGLVAIRKWARSRGGSPRCDAR